MADCSCGPARQEETALWNCGIAKESRALWVSAGARRDQTCWQRRPPPGILGRPEEETPESQTDFFVPVRVCVCIFVRVHVCAPRE